MTILRVRRLVIVVFISAVLFIITLLKLPSLQLAPGKVWTGYEPGLWAPGSQLDKQIPSDKTAFSNTKNFNDKIVNCDPYSKYGYFNYSELYSSEARYMSYDPQCQTMWPSPVNTIVANESLPELNDKSLLILGDSVDRNILEFLCTHLGQQTIKHPQNDYQTQLPEDQKLLGSHPQSCYIPRYNLSLANFFFFGLDEDSIWTDKRVTFQEPGNVWERLELLESALKSFERTVDLIMLNIGFWELARYDRLDDNVGMPEQLTLRPEQLDDYESRMMNFVRKLVDIIPNTRIVYRETHSPNFPNGPFFSGKSFRNYRFHRLKVRQTNEIAKKVMSTFGLEMWPVGEYINTLYEGEFMYDDSK